MKSPQTNLRAFRFLRHKIKPLPLATGKRHIAHERGGWVAAQVSHGSDALNLGPYVPRVTRISETSAVSCAGHFTFVPAGTLGSTLSRLGSPSIDAASTIPFDSTPISLAGCRFATITTFLPTRSSGA